MTRRVMFAHFRCPACDASWADELDSLGGPYWPKCECGHEAELVTPLIPVPVEQHDED